MNDSEKRRQALLRETRRLYPDNRPPAIHPRYGAIYNDLYPSNNSNGESSLGVRILISLILFALFAYSNTNHLELGTYSLSTLTTEIQSQPDWINFLIKMK